MIRIGELSLWVALLMSTWGTVVGVAGERLGRGDLVASARRALYAAAALLAIAALGVGRALLASDLSLAAVAWTTTTNLPPLFKAAALWTSQPGALLTWTLLLGACAALAVWTEDRAGEPARYLAGTCCALVLGFTLALCFAAYPYARLAFVPSDGRGMDPALQHPAAAAHAPTLLLGLAATSVPFALTVAALAARASGERWLDGVRRWSLFAWLFLTVGMVLGLRWAYAAQSSPTDWAWAPVRQGWVLPWFALTALLHALVLGERRGLLRGLSAALAAGSFLLATFVALAPPGAFARPPLALARPAAVRWIAVVVIAATAMSAYLLASRRARRSAPRRIRIASREAAILLALAVWGAMTLAGLVGALLGAVAGPAPPERATAALNRATVALALLVLALLAVGPVLSWRRSSPRTMRRLTAPVLGAVVVAALGLVLTRSGAERPRAIVLVTFALGGAAVAAAIVSAVGGSRTRARQRYGGALAHVGLVVSAASLAGVCAADPQAVSLGPGQRVNAVDPYGGRWSFVSQGLSRYPELNREVLAVLLEARRDGVRVGHVRAEQRRYVDAQGRQTANVVSVPGRLAVAGEDVFVSISDLTPDRAELTIAFVPLARWLSYGGAVMALGVVVALWPEGRSARVEQAALGEGSATAGSASTVSRTG